MKICICGSMKFAKEMLEVKRALEEMGLEAVLPINAFRNASEGRAVEREENLKRKINNNAIYKHYAAIGESDAVLVLNYDKNGIANYIGANTFLEMGFAHVLGKPLYILNELPDMDYIRDELSAFGPIVLKGDLKVLRLS